MNVVDVQAPIYEKKVGRPARNRKKNRTELEGGTKLSKEVESSLMLHMKNWTVLSQLQESTEIVTTQEISYE